MIRSLKISFSLLALTIFGLAPVLGQELIIEPTIRQVTVYRQGAQVRKEAATKIPAGRSTVIISRLSPDMDPNSVQILASGPVQLLSVDQRFNYLIKMEQPAELKAWKKELKGLKEKLEEKDVELALLGAEERMIVSNQDVQTGNTPVSTERLEQYAAYFQRKLKGIYQDRLKLNREKTEIQEQAVKLQQQIENYERSLAGKRAAEVVMDIQSERSQDIRFELRYVVNNAGWRPTYDIHGKSASDNIELIQKAVVFNRSQELWKDVELTLSSGNPNRNSRIPQLNPWWLRFREPVVYQKRYNEEMAQMDAARMEPMATPEAGGVMVQEEWTSVLYKLEGKYDFPADGSERTIVIDQQQFTGDYTYLSVPKLDPSVYLSASITGWESANLSAGEMHIFLDNAFVGKSYLDPGVVGDTLVLSMGRDERITVQRSKVKSMQKKQLFGSKVTETAAYEIEVKSSLSRVIQLEILDQVPLSTTSDIEVRDLSLNGGTMNKDDGTVRWKLDMAPQQGQKLKFGFTVRYPKGKILNLY